MSKEKLETKKKEPLINRIYLTEFLSGMIFFVVGMFFITPDMNPVFVKPLFLGSMIVCMLIVIAAIYARKTEPIDERAKFNVFKASFLTMSIVTGISILLAIGSLIFNIYITIHSAYIFFFLSFMLVIHACSFFSFERKGN